MQNLQQSPTLKRILKPIYGPPRTALQYFRARRINRAYDEQYADARAAYGKDAQPARLAIADLNQVGVRFLNGPESEGLVSLPADWNALVQRCAGAVAAAFERTENVLFLPAVERQGLPELTRDVSAMQRGEVISMQLRNPANLPGVKEIAGALVPQVQERVYGSYLIVDKVYVYRNVVSRQQEQVSWLWHYDNHPTPLLKLMIYLTDVDAGRAPFEYVRHRDTRRGLVFPPRPLLGNSRVPPERVDEYLRAGYERHLAVGPAGTAILFDDNVLHRATLARERHRDVLVLQIRPATFRPEHFVDEAWSGSFQHVDFNENPRQYAPRPKSKMLSA
jgi:hypothetical protein